MFVGLKKLEEAPAYFYDGSLRAFPVPQSEDKGITFTTFLKFSC